MAGLYLHIPFRKRRRPYDEAAYVTDCSQQQAFVRAAEKELRHLGRTYTAEPIRTLYLGGGRPSLLAPRFLDRLLDTARTAFEQVDLEETTLEANPADCTPEALTRWRAAGIDRLSLAVLSFYADDRDALTAPHTEGDAVRCIEAARSAGFDNLSVDLAFGWPDQPALHWKANLERVAKLEIPHLALMELTPPDAPESVHEAAADRYRFAMDYLPDYGYAHYEISHFARPGYRGRHNQRHWDHSNYLGVGPSAHSFWWTADHAATRWANVVNLPRYIALLDQHHLPLASKDPLSTPELAREYVMLRLRTAEGLNLDTLQTRYGTDLRALKSDALDQLRANGYLERPADSRIRLTDAGMFHCDTITARLLPD